MKEKTQMSTRKSNRSAQGSGTIRQRSDGRWEARYTVGRDPGTGKQLQRSVYGSTQKEVRLKLQQATVDINNGVYADPSHLTVGAWLDVWHAEYLGNVKPATVVSYAQQVKNYIKPAVGAVKLSSLQSAPIQKLYNDLQRSGLSPKTIKGVHGVLHKALQQAMKLGYIRSNPTSACILPRVEKPEIKPLDAPEMAMFLDAIHGHKLEALFIVAMFTGLREGELVGLTWDRIDLREGVIVVDRQLLRPRVKGDHFVFGPLKNDKTRTIRPAQFVIDTLRAYKKEQLTNRIRAGSLWNEGPGYVFSDEFGEHVSYWKLTKHFKNVLTSIGIEKRRFHDLRHTYAVSALRSGDDVKTVQGNLGHHSAAFTLDIYGHVTDSMKQESAGRMEAFIATLKKA